MARFIPHPAVGELVKYTVLIPSEKSAHAGDGPPQHHLPAAAGKLASAAGACRYVWNCLPDDQQALYDVARMCGAKPPLPTFFTLGKAFTDLRNATPWLNDLPFAPVRYCLKHQADAWKQFFRGQGGHPRFKTRRGDDSITIPDNVRIKHGRLWFPKIGWMTLRRRGGNPYPDGVPKVLPS